jgi:hypothetical protein
VTTPQAVDSKPGLRRQLISDFIAATLSFRLNE